MTAIISSVGRSRACVRTCVHACVCVGVCVRALLFQNGDKLYFYILTPRRRIMCIPRSSNAAGSERKPTLGFFLQCNPIDVQGNNNGWSCYARATLSILSREKPENDFSRRKIKGSKSYYLENSPCYIVFIH